MTRHDMNEKTGETTETPAPNIPRILVVTSKGHLTEPVMDYAISVAERLNRAIHAVYVNTLPFLPDGGARARHFSRAVRESATIFKEKAREKPVFFSYTEESGKVGKVVHRLCYSAKRIDFIVIDKGIRRSEVTRKAPVPVFSVIYTQSGKGNPLYKKRHHFNNLNTGGFPMSAKRTRYAKKCLIFGLGSAALYAAVFTSSETVMEYYTRGGWYAILPVATVFAFSYFHGSFTSAFWSMLGIEGSQKAADDLAEKREKSADTVQKRRDDRPRAQINA
ncbi:universal stress protein [Desulfomarina sp.]